MSECVFVCVHACVCHRLHQACLHDNISASGHVKTAPEMLGRHWQIASHSGLIHAGAAILLDNKVSVVSVHFLKGSLALGGG